MSENGNNIEIRTCCICLTANSLDGHTINSESPLLQMYSYCFGVSMDIKGIPRKMCGSCRIKLEEFSIFKKMALRSDKLWNSVVINSNNTDIIKIEKSDTIETNDNFTCNDDVYIDDDTNNKIENTKDINLIDNTKIEVKDEIATSENIAYEFICYSCECVFDSEESCKEHFLNNNCIKKERDLTLNSSRTMVLQTNGKFRDSKIISDKVKRKFKKTPKRKIKKCPKKKMKSHRNNADDEKTLQKKSDVPPKSYDCGLCKEITFDNESSLHQHLTEHSNNNDLCCKICDFNGRDFADITSHRFIHMSKEHKIIIKCHLCDKRFHVPLRLQFHYRSVHLNQKGGRCSKCDKTYTNFKKWKDHEKLHEGYRFVCDFCDRKFYFRYQIIEHLRYHYNVFSWVCESCGRGFHKKSSLRNHIMCIHTKNKAIKCTHCNKMFKNHLTYRCHMREVTSEKHYQCEFCSKRYRFSCDLRSHRIWHLDDRNYQCKICGQAYKSKQYLKVHLLKHSGDKQHKCDQCTMCFATSGQLKVHASVHTGVRRHKCTHCPRSFNGKKDLLLHLLKCHNISSSPSKDSLVPSHYNIKV